MREVPLDTVLTRLLTVVQDLLPGTLASVLLAEPDGLTLGRGVGPNLPLPYMTAIDGLVIGPDQGSCGTAAHRREVVVVSDIDTDPLWDPFRPLAAEAGLRSCWSVPILSGDDLLGTFAMYQRVPASPGDDDLALAADFAGIAALAIERDRVWSAHQANLNDEREARHLAERTAAQIQNLQEAAASLAAAASSSEVVDLLVGEVTTRVGATAIWVAVVDKAGLNMETVATVGYDPDLVTPFQRFPVDAAVPLAESVRTGAPMWLASYRELTSRFPALPAAHVKDGATAILPLHDGPNRIGVIGMKFSAGHVFTRSDQDYLTTLTQMTALALRRAHRHEVDQAIAGALQRALLTEPPRLDWVDIAVRYRPAARTAEVGGDWYDAFSLPDGRLAVAIGDVMGHDLQAAATMGQIRSMMRALACDSGAGPAEVLSHFDALNQTLKLTSFTSAVFGHANRTSAGVSWQWSNAGHPPPLLIDPHGVVQLLTARGGPVLGPQHRGPRTTQTTTLSPGSTLILYTDGLVEAPDQDFDQRLAALIAHVDGHSDLPLEQLCDDIVGQFAGDGSDDVALIALRTPLS